MQPLDGGVREAGPTARARSPPLLNSALISPRKSSQVIMAARKPQMEGGELNWEGPQH